MVPETPLTIDLGTHTLEIAPDTSIVIAGEQIALQLDWEETYRLLVSLTALFAEQEARS